MSARPVLIAAVAKDPFAAQLVQLIRSDGCEVLVSRDVEGAFRTARARRPALIVLDAVLRGGDGFSLCRRLKDDPMTRDLPVFFFSVLMVRDRCVEAGADGFLLKPVEQELLLNQIREVLNSRVSTLHHR